MKDIDKNDVEISTLFKWGEEFEIDSPKGPKKFWMRIVGDADLNRARVFGLRDSADLRRKLKDKETDESRALIPDFDVTERDKIIEATVLYKTTDLTNKASEKLDLNYPKEPKTDATQEEHEKYQAEVDAFPQYVEKEITKVFNKEVNLEKKSLNKLSNEELLKEYENTLINKLCENEMMKSFQDMCVYFASFKDENFKTPLFSSVEEFQNLPTRTKEDFYIFYASLNPTTDELKK